MNTGKGESAHSVVPNGGGNQKRGEGGVTARVLRRKPWRSYDRANTTDVAGLLTEPLLRPSGLQSPCHFTPIAID